MNIKTKFDAGDSVWIIDDNEVINTVVVEIMINVDHLGNSSISYGFGKSKPHIVKRENKVYKTKEDLINYINKIK